MGWRRKMTAIPHILPAGIPDYSHPAEIDSVAPTQGTC